MRKSRWEVILDVAITLGAIAAATTLFVVLMKTGGHL